jgi:hypothetical protein
MKTTMIALLVGLTAAAPAMAQRTWYASRLYGDNCVPLDEISRDDQWTHRRVGFMHTPADFGRHLHDAGFAINKDPRSSDSLFIWEAWDSHGAQSFFMLFSDRDRCQSVTAWVERQPNTHPH